jgi:hypothetical protein
MRESAFEDRPHSIRLLGLHLPSQAAGLPVSFLTPNFARIHSNEYVRWEIGSRKI